MDGDLLLVEKHGPVTRLTLNRPDRLNALTIELFDALFKTLDSIAADPGCRVLVLTGSGRAFCAGQDLGERRREPGVPPADLAKSTRESYGPLIKRLTALPIPVIGAVNGVAAGAGTSVALACDIVIARRSARFLQPFVRLGLAPDAGWTAMMPRRVGFARAVGAALLAQPISAEQAAAWGMIWACVDDEAFDSEVDAVVQSLLAASPHALAATKRLIRDNALAELHDALAEESDTQGKLGFGPDYAEGVSAFAAKRPPDFSRGG